MPIKNQTKMNYKIITSFFILSVFTKPTIAQTTTYEYDKLYRLTKIIYNNGSTVSYHYDANGNSMCQYNLGTIKVFVFNINGNWSDSTNCLNNSKPPLELPTSAQIIIDPIVSGECILDVPQKIMSGASIRVEFGKKFRLAGN